MATEIKSPEDEFTLPIISSEAEGNTAATESLDGTLDNEAVKAIGIEQGVSTGTPLPGSPLTAGGLPPLQPPSLGDTGTAASANSLPHITDDGDLIEKEWIAKAKAIVERTKGDPFIQSREINAVKVDYLKRRYNKDIGAGN